MNDRVQRYVDEFGRVTKRASMNLKDEEFEEFMQAVQERAEVESEQLARRVVETEPDDE